MDLYYLYQPLELALCDSLVVHASTEPNTLFPLSLLFDLLDSPDIRNRIENDYKPIIVQRPWAFDVALVKTAYTVFKKGQLSMSEIHNCVKAFAVLAKETGKTYGKEITADTSNNKKKNLNKVRVADCCLPVSDNRYILKALDLIGRRMEEEDVTKWLKIQLVNLYSY